MVKVRLSRAGSKKRPFYHIVVAPKENARDSGAFIERIGIYDPSRPIQEARVNHDRLAYWKGVGAQVSDRVSKVAKQHAQAVVASA